MLMTTELSGFICPKCRLRLSLKANTGLADKMSVTERRYLGESQSLYFVNLFVVAFSDIPAANVSRSLPSGSFVY